MLGCCNASSNWMIVNSTARKDQTKNSIRNMVSPSSSSYELAKFSQNAGTAS